MSPADSIPHRVRCRGGGRISLRLTFVVAALCLAARDSLAQTPETVQLAFFERDSAAAESTFALVTPLSPADPRWREAHRLADNEAARFARQLIASAWRVAGRAGALPALPVVIAPGGNNAARGLRIRQAGASKDRRVNEPYLVLDLRADRFRITFLHEAGHVAQMIAQGLETTDPPWTAVAHSTYAVTDRLTALAEGYAIQLEATWAHFGRDARQQAFSRRLRPEFDARGTSAPYYFPANDLLNFSQTWGRYADVRDALAAFEPQTYDGDYTRSQYDPSRNRATLRRPGAMLASEGVVASTLFWIGAQSASARGAVPGRGLAPAVLRAQRKMLAAMRASAGTTGTWRPDLIDLVTSFGPPGSPERRDAIARFIDVTRGVTARPGLRTIWAQFYDGAIHLDFGATGRASAAMDSARTAILGDAVADESVLRRGLGPVLPVRAEGLVLRLVALGGSAPVSVDLNTLGEADLRAILPGDVATQRRLREALDSAPFTSLADFEGRIGRPPAALGLVPAPVGRRQ